MDERLCKYSILGFIAFTAFMHGLFLHLVQMIYMYDLKGVSFMIFLPTSLSRWILSLHHPTSPLRCITYWCIWCIVSRLPDED